MVCSVGFCWVVGCGFALFPACNCFALVVMFNCLRCVVWVCLGYCLRAFRLRCFYRLGGADVGLGVLFVYGFSVWLLGWVG